MYLVKRFSLSVFSVNSAHATGAVSNEGFAYRVVDRISEVTSWAVGSEGVRKGKWSSGHDGMRKNYSKIILELTSSV
jgi:hypothetical protein